MTRQATPAGARVTLPAGPTRRGSWLSLLGSVAPISLGILGSASIFRATVDVYDAGLALTLARFTNLSTLPYRDLWTLYGPGPPLFGKMALSLGGPDVLLIQIEQVAVHTLMVVGLYLLLLRFVPWWVAAVLAAVPATLAPVHTHYAHSLVFVVWGLWFVHRAELGRSERRLALGAALIGSSFLGRYEFAGVGVGVILLLWWYLRPRLGRLAARRMLTFGLTIPLLFLVYLLVVVGLERAWLNLVEYPIGLYPRAYCRGIATPWAAAFEGLFAPLAGRWWTGSDLMLGGATYVAPLAGAAAVLIGARRFSGRGISGSVTLAVGALTLFLWVSMRPRSGTSPQPVWPMLLVSVAVVLEATWRRFPQLARGVSGLVVAILAVTVFTSWVPGIRASLEDWPASDPRFGFARPPAGLYDEEVWVEVERTVHRYAEEDAPIFVATTQHTGTFANAPMFYWYVDRVPVSRFIEYSPCLTDTERVQAEIARDLAGTNVVIATTFFGWYPPPFAAESTLLDEYLAAHFRQVLDRGLPADPQEYRIEVLVRSEPS